MYAASLAGLALIIGLLAVAAIGLGLLTRAGRDPGWAAASACQAGSSAAPAQGQPIRCRGA